MLVMGGREPFRLAVDEQEMLDVFVTLFVVAAALFAVLDRDRGDQGAMRRPWLALCGVSVGLAP